MLNLIFDLACQCHRISYNLLISKVFDYFNKVELVIKPLLSQFVHFLEFMLIWPNTAWEQAAQLIAKVKTNAIFVMQLNSSMNINLLLAFFGQSFYLNFLLRVVFEKIGISCPGHKELLGCFKDKAVL